MKKPQQPEIAVALRYDGKTAPRVTAKGENEVAQRIREVAKDCDIPLHEDPALAYVLSQIELGEEIPEFLYRAVAEVIAFAYILAGRVSAVPQASQPECPTQLPALPGPGGE